MPVRSARIASSRSAFSATSVSCSVWTSRASSSARRFTAPSASRWRLQPLHVGLDGVRGRHRVGVRAKRGEKVVRRGLEVFLDPRDGLRHGLPRGLGAGFGAGAALAGVGRAALGVAFGGDGVAERGLGLGQRVVRGGVALVGLGLRVVHLRALRGDLGGLGLGRGQLAFGGRLPLLDLGDALSGRLQPVAPGAKLAGRAPSRAARAPRPRGGARRPRSGGRSW